MDNIEGDLNIVLDNISMRSASGDTGFAKVDRWKSHHVCVLDFYHVNAVVWTDKCGELCVSSKCVATADRLLYKWKIWWWFEFDGWRSHLTLPNSNWQYDSLASFPDWWWVFPSLDVAHGSLEALERDFTSVMASYCKLSTLKISILSVCIRSARCYYLTSWCQLNKPVGTTTISKRMMTNLGCAAAKLNNPNIFAHF